MTTTARPNWAHAFDFGQPVIVASTGERGIIIGKFVTGQYCVRGVDGDAIWSGALTANGAWPRLGA